VFEQKTGFFGLRQQILLFEKFGDSFSSFSFANIDPSGFLKENPSD